MRDLRDLWDATAAMMRYGHARVDEECRSRAYGNPGEYNICLSEWMGWR